MNDATKKFFANLLANVIEPNAERIATIVATGDVAVALHALLPDGEEIARALGWDGGAPVFKMSDTARDQMIAVADGNGERLTARWLRGRRVGRIFVVTGPGGHMLVNVEDREYTIEPGSLVAEHPQA